MCKRGLFQKLIYMHNKKYISMSCKRREAQAVQSFGIRDNRALQVHISTENPCSNQQSASEAKQKAIPI